MLKFMSVEDCEKYPVDSYWNTYPVRDDMDGGESDPVKILNLSEAIGCDDDLDVLVVTTGSFNYGAAAIMHPDTIAALRERKVDKFYLLPSSVHEVLIVPWEKRTSEDDAAFADMVREINAAQLEDCDKLSDAILYYNGDAWEVVNGREGK